MRLPASRVVALGDAENDRSFWLLRPQRGRCECEAALEIDGNVNVTQSGWPGRRGRDPHDSVR